MLEHKKNYRVTCQLQFPAKSEGWCWSQRWTLL